MIQLTGAGKRYGPKILFENADWLVTPNERIGIVGANGTGKSSLLKVLAGIEGLDSGAITTQKGVTLGYLPQDGLSLSGRTVFAECMTVFADLRALEEEQEHLARRMAELDPASAEYAQVADRFHRAESEFRARDGYAIEAQVGAVLSGLGFPQRDWKRRTEEFSGGWQMRIALAKLLLEKPNLLLLDEPTNHLDLEARNWLEDYLAAYPNAFVLVSHDRYFLDVTVRKIAELWNKGLHFYTGGLHALRGSRRTSGARSCRPPTEPAGPDRSSSKPSSTASATRPPRPSRCRAASRSWRRSSASRFRPKRRPSTSAFRSPSRAAASWRSSRTSPRATATTRSSPDVDFIIERGDRVALVGVNGAGKSTLIKILAGAEPVTAGEYTLGHNAQPDYFAQDQYKELDPNARMIDDLATVAPRATNTELRSILGCFLFSEDDVFKTDRRALRRRAQPLRAGPHAHDALQLPAARRAHQPPRHARQGRAADGAAGVHRHGGVRLARPLLHRQAGHARLRSGGRQGPRLSRQLRGLPVAQTGWRSAPRRRRTNRRRQRRSGGRAAPAAEPAQRSATRRLNPIKLRQMKERRDEIEEEVTRLEAEIADYEAALGNFVSVEETQRVTDLLDARRADLESLLGEWEEVAQSIEANS